MSDLSPTVALGGACGTFQDYLPKLSNFQHITSIPGQNVV